MAKANSSARKATYQGELAKRAAPPTPRRSALTSEDDYKAAVAEWKRTAIMHDLRGISLLLDHYGITDRHFEDAGARFLWLAIRLAKDHVPYFQEAPKKAGRKANIIRKLRLPLDVAVLRAGGVVSDRAACEELARQREYPGVDVDDLTRRLREARRTPFGRMAQEIIENVPPAKVAEAAKILRE